MIKTRWLPFRWTLASRGLHGEAYALAEARYRYDGEDLERAIAQIRHAGDPLALAEALLDIDVAHGYVDACDAALKRLKLRGRDDARSTSEVLVQHQRRTAYEHDVLLAKLDHPDDPGARAAALLAVEHRHGRIDDYAYERQRLQAQFSGTALLREQIDLDHRHGLLDGFERDRRQVETLGLDGVARAVKLLEVEHKHHRIDDIAFAKQRATLLEEPWVDIVDHGFNPDDGINGVFMEFDWNSHWIDYLRMNGYTGLTDQSVFEQWFADVCNAQTATHMEAAAD